MRCKNVTISNQNIKHVELKARDLLDSLNDIQFVLTEDEQRGLFNIIHALEWEPHSEQRRKSDQYEPELTPVYSPALRALLDRIKQ